MLFLWLLPLELGCLNKDNSGNSDQSVVDKDGDGVKQAFDCDDENPDVYPDAAEICNGIDDDCNELVDDQDPGLDASTGAVFFVDQDGDGQGVTDETVLGCAPPDGFVEEDTDCDDTDSGVYLGAPEYCNGRDDSCDGQIDLDAVDELFWYQDADGDGHGDAGAFTQACFTPDGYVLSHGDCDDSDVSVHPDAMEQCDGLDNNCNELVDDSDPDLDLASANTFFPDLDGDGYGDPSQPAYACLQPSGHVASEEDCLDSDPLVNPAAAEICNGLDDDCSPSTSESGMASVLSASGEFTDVSGLLQGAPAAPVSYMTEASEHLVFCDGTFYLNIESQHDLLLQGFGSSVILDGAGGVAVSVSEGSLSVQDLQLSNGSPAIYCDNATVQLLDTDLVGNSGENGGAMQLQFCDLFSDGAFFSSNVSVSGGAIAAEFGELELLDSVIEDNQATERGGAIYASTASLELTNSWLVENQALQGGSLYLEHTNTVCTGASSLDAGIELNSSSDGAIWLDDASVWLADMCDLGTDATDSNSPVDVYTESGFSYLASDDASFSCSGGRCGTSLYYDIGGILVDSYSNNNAFRGNVYTVEGNPTLDQFEMEMSFTSCVFDFYIFERTDAADDWALRWHRQREMSNTTGWASSGDIGFPLLDQMHVMLGVGWTCDGAPDYYSYTGSLTDNHGLGYWYGERSIDTNHCSVTSSSCDTAIDADSFVPSTTLSSAYLYRQRIYVTHLD